jgi:hypothetical protein
MIKRTPLPFGSGVFLCRFYISPSPATRFSAMIGGQHAGITGVSNWFQFTARSFQNSYAVLS